MPKPITFALQPLPFTLYPLHFNLYSFLTFDTWRLTPWI